MDALGASTVRVRVVAGDVPSELIGERELEALEGLPAAEVLCPVQWPEPNCDEEQETRYRRLTGQ